MLKSAKRQLRQVILEAQARGYTPIIPIFHLRTADYMSKTRHEPLTTACWAWVNAGPGPPLAG